MLTISLRTMNKTKIEWCDYTWNPIRGYCPNNCTYCYAHRMYDRFGWDKDLRFDIHELQAINMLKKPSRIFVGSMIDMYHNKIPREWVKLIIRLTRMFQQHTFITLTKFPDNLFPFAFPKNWWVGCTIEDARALRRSWAFLDCFTFAGLSGPKGKKIISFEPLLGDIPVSLNGIDWIIIGGLTPRPVHKKEWIDNLLRLAGWFNVPVFIKNNARYPEVRQEFPA